MPDNKFHYFLEEIHGHDSYKWIEAMKEEIYGLLALNTWKRVNKFNINKDKNGNNYNILKSNANTMLHVTTPMRN